MADRAVSSGSEPGLTIAAGLGVSSGNTDLVVPKACIRPSFKTSRWSVAPISDGRWAMTTTMPPRERTAPMARASARSPSLSRLELGSSRTTRNGSPYSARASAMRSTLTAR